MSVLTPTMIEPAPTAAASNTAPASQGVTDNKPAGRAATHRTAATARLGLRAALSRGDDDGPHTEDDSEEDLPDRRAARFHAGNPRRAAGIPLTGGGSTDLREGFTAALADRPRPDVLVVLTDGQTPWPSTQPPCRTVIGLFSRPRTADDDNDELPEPPPEWARVVRIG